MYYQFLCGNFNVMSNLNRKNITFTPEMLGKYYSEKFQHIQEEQIMQQDLNKTGNYLSVKMIGFNAEGETYLYLLKKETHILGFLKDKHGFRVDIAEQELDKILSVYADTLKALQAKISNNLTVDKMVPDIQAFTPILSFHAENLQTKSSEFNYDDYEYL